MKERLATPQGLPAKQRWAAPQGHAASGCKDRRHCRRTSYKSMLLEEEVGEVVAWRTWRKVS